MPEPVLRIRCPGPLISSAVLPPGRGGDEQRESVRRRPLHGDGHGIVGGQVIDLDGSTLANVLSVSDVLAQAGLVVESFGEGAALVREVPAAIGNDGTLRVSLRSAADAVKLICMGANRLGFGTASMVAIGCTICRGCQLINVALGGRDVGLRRFGDQPAAAA